MNESPPDPKPINYGISWLRPPFGTIFILLIPLGYSGYGAAGLESTLSLVLAFLFAFSPTLLFVHLGKHCFVKQIMAAFSFLPWVLIAQMPEIPSDDPPGPPPTVIESFTRMFWFSFLPGLIPLVLSIGLYFFWKAGFDPMKKDAPEPSRENPKT